MVLGLGLSKYLKRTPPADSRNLIEPNADIRYLAMKIRAGQTKNIYEFLDLSDNVEFYIEPEGRWACIFDDTQSFDLADIIWLQNQGTEVDIQAAINSVGASASISMFFPPGNWTIENSLSDNNRIVRLVGAGPQLTNFSINPTSPSALIGVSFSKLKSALQDIGFVSGPNHTSGDLVKLSAMNEGEVIKCWFFTPLTGNGITPHNCINNSNTDRLLIQDCHFLTDGFGISITGASTFDSKILDNWFIGKTTGPTVARGIEESGPNARIRISGNHFRDLTGGVRIPAPVVSFDDSIISDNIFNNVTAPIDDLTLDTPVWLCHGNTGGAGSTITGSVKARDNIGIADQN